jgi:hypothetical protein
MEAITAVEAPAIAAAEPDPLVPGMDADFDRDDTWEFLYRWRNSMNSYGEECKKTARLERELADKDAVLEGTKAALATVKQQLADFDAEVASNFL